MFTVLMIEKDLSVICSLDMVSIKMYVCSNALYCSNLFSLSIWLLLLQKNVPSYKYCCTLANFRIEKKIGRGQFSEVYKATYLLEGQLVALKKVQVNYPQKSWFSTHKVKVQHSGAYRILLQYLSFEYSECVLNSYRCTCMDT